MKQGFWTISRILNYLLALVLFFLTLEFAARIDDRVSFGAPFWVTYSSDALRSRDAEGIRINVPGGRFEKWENSSLGFRGPEITPQKPDGVIRVVCMGTSETYGLYEKPGKEWPAQLRDKLPETRGYEVINAATVGLPMEDYRSYIEKYVLSMEPDIMIVMVSPQSYVAGRIRAEKNQDGPGAMPADVASGSPIKDVLTLSRSKPKFLQMIRGFLSTDWIDTYDAAVGRRQIRAAEQFRLKGEAPIDSISEPYLSAYVNDMRQLMTFLKAHGIYPVVLAFPTLMSPDNIEDFPGTFLAGRRFIVELSLRGMADASLKFNVLNRRIADELEIGYIDMYSIIPKDLTHFADNVHYTDTGAELVAGTVAEYILNDYDWSHK